MRFRSLTLDAFGPFTAERLDLSGGAPGGLHVVYGPNEAGKSTSLRAVTGLLFGIPERTTDAHLHPTKNLSLSTVLERGSEKLAFSRRKRRKDSLVDPQGQPLPDGVLQPWLRGLDERSFITRFGLDQTRLEEGAEALLGGSEEGLFAAGTAGADVRRLLDELERQATELYLPRGTKPRLNRALTALAEASRAARLAVRPPERWREQKRAHEQATQRVEALDAERRRLRSEQGRLSRLASVLSDVSRWVDASSERKHLGTLPELPADASERREQAERRAREADLEVARLERELADLAQLQEALPPPSALATVEDERLAWLEQKGGQEFKAREDLPKLEARLAAALEEMRRLLAGLGHANEAKPLDRTDALRVEAALERQVRRLAAEHGKLSVGVEQSGRLLGEVRRDLDAARAALASEPEPQGIEGLELALGRGRRAEHELNRREGLARECRRLAKRTDSASAELGISIPHLELVRLLPSAREVESARVEYEAAQTEVRRIALARRDQSARIDEATARIEALRAGGDVPTEARLGEARRARDEVHARLVAHVDDALFVRGAAQELAQRELEADRIADRLRLEAHRVSELHALEEARQVARAQESRLASEAAAVEARLATFEATWRDRWAALGLAQIAPADFVQLRQRLRELAELLEQLEVTTREGEELDAVIGAARSELERAIGVASPSVFAAMKQRGAPLSAQLEAAQRLAQELKDARERRRLAAKRALELEALLSVRSAELEQAERALAAWKSAWQSLAPRLGLAETAPPDEALAVLTELANLARLADDARDKERRVRGIQRDSTELEAELRRLSERHGLELSLTELSEAAKSVLTRVRQARDAEKERSRIQAECARRRERVAQALSARDTARSALTALTHVAGVTEASELPRVEAAVRRGRELDAQLATLEEALRSKAGSGSLRELIEEAQSTRYDELRAQQDEVDRRLEELEEELRDAEHAAQGIEHGLELYRSEEGALAQQSVETATAEARESLRDYLRVRAARVLLQREVARYAERHQGPILARASEHFPRLTLGRYSGLRVGLGERTLRCVRDGREVEVSELSRGTRAQLYLALRLASLEHHFEHHSPVPLVFDDLFVDFDDDRAAAAFELLGELAERVQILYFTHLGRDLQAASDAVPRSRLFEHRIGVEGVRSASAG